MKTFFLICISTIAIFILLQVRNIWMSGSIALMNITQDTSWYQGDIMWITRYNEAIWLAHNAQYKDAKFVLTPLLNDTTIPRKAEIAELYGDLIYSSSGSVEDSIRMYERSLTFSSNERVQSKIDYLRMKTESKSGSGEIKETKTNTGTTLSGTTEKESKKAELQKTATQRAEYLSNNVISAGQYQSTLQQLIESAQSGSVGIVQDW